MTKLTNEQIESILEGAPEGCPSVITEIYGHPFNYCHDDDIHQISDLREILSLRQEVEHLKSLRVVTPEMLLKAQRNSELGVIATGNYIGGYSLMTELYQVMFDAAIKEQGHE